MSNPDQNWFKAHMFVDSADDDSPSYLGRPLQVSRINFSDISRALQQVKAHKERNSKGSEGIDIRTLVLVCGPNSMINAIAGPRKSETDPGPVTGVLQALGFDQKNVRKL